ncbi:MAG: tetratricopeptide repeat protein [Candidatus Midichloria sp.]|nr:tetratricopeptide repeat protein [Candidatus Midichloria sp.]
MYIVVWLVHYTQSNCIESLALYRKSIALKIRLLGEKSAEITEIYVDMTRLCKTQNNYAESLDYYQRALIIYKEINEENSIDVSWVYHKIAELYEE